MLAQASVVGIDDEGALAVAARELRVLAMKEIEYGPDDVSLAGAADSQRLFHPALNGRSATILIELGDDRPKVVRVHAEFPIVYRSNGVDELFDLVSPTRVRTEVSTEIQMGHEASNRLTDPAP